MNKLMNTINIANPNFITLYHGTKLDNFTPDPNFKNPKNDYGSGLYMTRDLDKAKQWAMSKYNNTDKGYAYEYEIDLSKLNILDLRKRNTEEWIAILLQYRGLTDSTDYVNDRIKEFVGRYSIKVDGYDIIIGYRADDSYYKYMNDFFNVRISDTTLKQAMMLGKLGDQYCLKTDKAYSELNFKNVYEATERDRANFNKIDLQAMMDYRKLVKSSYTGKSVLDYLK